MHEKGPNSDCYPRASWTIVNCAQSLSIKSADLSIRNLRHREPARDNDYTVNPSPESDKQRRQGDE